MDRLPPSNQDQSLQQSNVEEEFKNNINKGGNRLKRRGRRRGSKNKAKLPCHEAWAHVLEVNAGQDILESVARFARRHRVGVNVINGSGAISTVILQDPAGADVGLPLQGQFEIISLSGSILPSPSPPAAQWLAVSLAGEQGQVVGGRVMGPMVAARMVVIVVSLQPRSPEVVDGSLQGSPPLQQLLGNVVTGNFPVLEVPLHPSPQMMASVVAGNIPVLDGPLQESPAIQTLLQQPTGGMVDGNIPPPFNGQLPADDEHGWWGDGQVMDCLWNWDA